MLRHLTSKGYGVLPNLFENDNLFGGKNSNFDDL